MLKINDFDAPSPKTFYLVFQGMRFSWDSNNKADSTLLQNGAYGNYKFTLGEDDKKLALKLIKAGTDHSKFMRQLPIVVDITAASYLWWDLDTYKVGTTRNSSSSMHTLGKEELTVEHFSFDDVPEIEIVQTLAQLNRLRARWIEAGKRKGPEATEWRALVQALPRAFNFRSMWSANYAVLRSIYFARRNHRLAEWRVFTDWITTLPYGELITHE